jgi:hypothetical protein
MFEQKPVALPPRPPSEARKAIERGLTTESSILSVLLAPFLGRQDLWQQ